MLHDLGMKIRFLLLVFAYFVLLGTMPAQAYLDPGTSSMIIQVVIGGIAAAGTTVVLYWGKIQSFFQKDDKPDSDIHNQDR